MTFEMGFEGSVEGYRIKELPKRQRNVMPKVVGCGVQDRGLVG